jgi:hypothetical protein
LTSTSSRLLDLVLKLVDLVLKIPDTPGKLTDGAVHIASAHASPRSSRRAPRIPAGQLQLVERDAEAAAKLLGEAIDGSGELDHSILLRKSGISGSRPPETR